MSQKYELEIRNKQGEPDVMVDFYLDGMILEIKLWADFVEDHIPVTEMFMVKNYPSKFDEIYNRVEERVNEIKSAGKEFNSDEVA